VGRIYFERSSRFLAETVIVEFLVEINESQVVAEGGE
jgi:hypothetical protein